MNDDSTEKNKPSIVITGISGRIGRLLAKWLHRDGRYRIVGIDRRPLPNLPPDIAHSQVDLRSKKTRSVFSKERPVALVHLGLMHDPRRSKKEHHDWNVVGTSRLLEYCRAYNVPKVVFLSSHYVYGARPENPQFLTEDAPLLGAQDTPGLRDLVEADMLAGSFFWKCDEINTIILRPVHVLGRVKNAISNLLRMNRIPKLIGFDPMMQIIHEKDVVESIVVSLFSDARGIYNVAGPGEIPYSVILEELGKPILPIPHFCPRSLMKLLWLTGSSPIEGPEMDHLRFISMVDDSRIRKELGFSPKYSIKESIRSVLEPTMDPKIQ